MQFILISACLLGEPVRYDGGDKKYHHEIMQRWLKEGRVVSVCPEITAGLPVPRPAAEISGSAGGAKVLNGEARVIGTNAEDFSDQFISGARQVLELAKKLNIRIAILKDGSPSCGTHFTYDGTFSSKTIEKPGVTAALLEQAGIHVFSETQLEKANTLITRLEA